jgi:hypothetical protein
MKTSDYKTLTILFFLFLLIQFSSAETIVRTFDSTEVVTEDGEVKVYLVVEDMDAELDIGIDSGAIVCGVSGPSGTVGTGILPFIPDSQPQTAIVGSECGGIYCEAGEVCSEGICVSTYTDGIITLTEENSVLIGYDRMAEQYITGLEVDIIKSDVLPRIHPLYGGADINCPVGFTRNSDYCVTTTEDGQVNIGGWVMVGLNTPRELSRILLKVGATDFCGDASDNPCVVNSVDTQILYLLSPGTSSATDTTWKRLEPMIRNKGIPLTEEAREFPLDNEGNLPLISVILIARGGTGFNAPNPVWGRIRVDTSELDATDSEMSSPVDEESSSEHDQISTATVSLLVEVIKKVIGQSSTAPEGCDEIGDVISYIEAVKEGLPIPDC